MGLSTIWDVIFWTWLLTIWDDISATVSLTAANNNQQRNRVFTIQNLTSSSLDDDQWLEDYDSLMFSKAAASVRWSNVFIIVQQITDALGQMWWASWSLVNVLDDTNDVANSTWSRSSKASDSNVVLTLYMVLKTSTERSSLEAVFGLGPYENDIQDIRSGCPMDTIQLTNSKNNHGWWPIDNAVVIAVGYCVRHSTLIGETKWHQ